MGKNYPKVIESLSGPEGKVSLPITQSNCTDPRRRNVLTDEDGQKKERRKESD